MRWPTIGGGVCGRAELPEPDLSFPILSENGRHPVKAEISLSSAQTLWQRNFSALAPRFLHLDVAGQLLQRYLAGGSIENQDAFFSVWPLRSFEYCLLHSRSVQMRHRNGHLMVVRHVHGGYLVDIHRGRLEIIWNRGAVKLSRENWDFNSHRIEWKAVDLGLVKLCPIFSSFTSLPSRNLSAIFRGALIHIFG